MCGPELVVSIMTSLISAVAKSVVKPAYKEISYAFESKCQSCIDELTEQVASLREKKEMVKVPVDQARRNGHDIYDGVDKWLLKVDKFIEDAEKSIPEDKEKAKMRCFIGLCPPYLTRRKISKKAVKTAKAGADLLGEGNFSHVGYLPRHQRTASMYVKDYEAFQSREEKLVDVMEVLKDPNVNVIGIHGMAGVGKTTLVRKFAWQAVENNLFDEVVIVDVSQNPDVKTIQDKFAFELGMVFGPHESVFVRAQQIRERLTQENKVLVILDNIWAQVDFYGVGIPSRDADNREDVKGIIDDQRTFKILLTSRFRDVLQKDMRAQTILIEGLRYDEAMKLFWKTLDGVIEKSDFKNVADEIVRKCDGLPIAIATIAKYLKGKSINIWRDALHKLKSCDPSSVTGMNEIVKMSYEFLEDPEARSLFLLCGTYDASCNINIDDLLSYGMGLGWFKNVSTLEIGRNRMDKLFDDLKASCLLLSDETIPAGFCKMHDMVHAVAVSIASTELSDHGPMYNIQDDVHLNQVLEENTSTAISMPFRDIRKLPERLGCPKLKLFSLFTEDNSLQIPGSFFEGMTELRILDLEYVNLRSLPSSFCCQNLMNLRTLILDECLLTDVAKIGELRKLEVLSLWRSEIVRLPEEIGELAQLRLLNLGNCSKLQVIAPNVLSRLTALEELYMHNSFVQWEDERRNNQRRTNASLAELRELSHLTTLNIHVRDAQLIPQNLLFGNLKRYKIFIGYVWNWSGKYEASKTLKIKLDDSIYLSQGVKDLLERTEDLYLDKMSGVSNVVYELNGEGFPQLKHLHVQNGSQFFSIVDSEDGVPSKVFPMLESFVLRNLLNLEKICRIQLTEESFRKLRIVKVDKCHKLKHLFCFPMAKNLSGLQEMEVIHCWKLKEIFSDEVEDRVHNNEMDRRQIEFTQLHSLTLQGLPKFVNLGLNVKTSNLASQVRPGEITAENDHEDFKSLFSEKVFLPRLENLKLSTIKIKSIWLQKHLAMSTSGQFLTNLTIDRCNNLKFLFPSSMVDLLGQLQNLHIYDCASLEGIFDAGRVGENKMIKQDFAKLLCIELKDLPNFTRFGTANLVEFPSLNKLRIEKCPNLKTFLWAPTLADETLERCHNDIRSLFDEKTRFPNLEKLEIFYQDKLRKIWHSQLPINSFCKLREVKVGYCKEVLQIFPSNMLEGLQRLDTLMVRNCDSLKEIFIAGGTQSGTEFQLQEMHLYNLPRLQSIWNIQAQGSLAFKKLVSMKVHCCNNLKSLFPYCIAKGLLQLKELELISCAVVEIVAKEEKAHPRFCFPRLTSLTLWNLSRLQYFYPEKHISKWPMLRKVVICRCVKLRVFASKFLSFQEINGESQHEILMQEPSFWINEVALPKLESNLYMKEIRQGSKLSEYLQNLKVLELICFNDIASVSPSCCIHAFPNLEKHVFSDASSEEIFSGERFGCEDKQAVKPSELRGIETLEISECYKLISLVPSSVTFINLTTLEVSLCNRLANLMTISTAKSLVRLSKLSLSDCLNLQEIISHKGDAGKPVIVFRELKYLKLRCLPSLTSFCSGIYSLEFPSLEQVFVERCSEMKRFSERVLKTPKLRRVKLAEGGDDWCWEGDLNTTIREMFINRDLQSLQDLSFISLAWFLLFYFVVCFSLFCYFSMAYVP